MDLPHSKAFELLQRSIDGPLSAKERADLERHFGICIECQTNATLHRWLEEEASEHQSIALPPKNEIERTILETQKHFRRWRMLNRLFISPVRFVAWAAVAVAFVLAVVLVFDLAPQKNQTGSVAVTRVFKEPMVEVVEVTPVFDADAEKETLESLTKAYSDAFEIQDVQVHRDIEDDDFKLFGGNFNWQGVLTADDTSYEPGARGTEITVDSREWFIGPQLAVSRSHETLVWPDKSVHKNLFTMVWHKKGGQWYLVHTHMSEY